MKRITGILLCWVAIAVTAPQANALNILLTNDDGSSTPNIRALYTALKAEGHDVIMSAPSENQSGKSAGMNWFEDVSFSVAADNPDIHLVDGTPAMAVLYGIDIVSKKRWGAYPDLVVSGPNEGNNAGIITNHSGTVGAAVTALYRGIPAIAVSADKDTETDGTEEMVARITIRVLTALNSHAPLLPPGTGINLNIPSLVGVENADDVAFAFTEIGTSGDYIPKFTMDLGRDRGFLEYIDFWPDNYPNTYAPYHDIPGITIGNAEELASLPETARHPEAELLASGKVTISGLNVTHAAGLKQRIHIKSRLQSLVDLEKPECRH